MVIWCMFTAGNNSVQLQTMTREVYMYISILYISFTGRSVYQSYPEQCYNIVLLFVPAVFICIGARVL